LELLLLHVHRAWRVSYQVSAVSFLWSSDKDTIGLITSINSIASYWVEAVPQLILILHHHFLLILIHAVVWCLIFRRCVSQRLILINIFQFWVIRIFDRSRRLS
jgi:hypothetical protein